jgi:hypothetical protein
MLRVLALLAGELSVLGGLYLIWLPLPLLALGGQLVAWSLLSDGGAE